MPLHIRAAVGCPGFLSDRDLEDGCYPPGPRPPAGGGGSYHPHHDGHGNMLGGDSYPSFGNPQGNVIAKLVSPIVSVVVVTLTLGAASYFQYNRRRNCFRTNEPENI
ncbi:LOW QUALITY PROTEIN: glycoprotein Xg [Balaenoptera ricei]|uniref:LOW QUALITY PROTEIN: glycoprotein Xg n=1 Tax=Balaenoptera ricei TaxID=2746895 RepID=UPI0028BF05CE|nr:LOW QUALITY PROTEIN: glycoprotein Xg [Balaenoptera ricei]